MGCFVIKRQILVFSGNFWVIISLFAILYGVYLSWHGSCVGFSFPGGMIFDWSEIREAA